MRQEFEHKKTGWRIAVKALTQGDIDDYLAAYKSLSPAKETTGESYGSTVRAAIQAGWLEEPALKVEDVRALPPNQVRWIALQLNTVYREATTIPPE